MDGTWEIVGRKDQELPLGTTLGNALRELTTNRFKSNAAKVIERLWGLDPKTAKNVVQRGNVSERTLTKAALSERWSLWMALGEQLFEQSYEDWKEQELQHVIEEANRELEKVRYLRSMGARLPGGAMDQNPAGLLVSDSGAEPAARGRGREAQTRPGHRAADQATRRADQRT